MSADRIFEVAHNDPIARDTYVLTLNGDTSDLTTPGQFVNVEVPGFYLRRPLSVADWSAGELQLIYKVLGQGTAAMTRMSPGDQTRIISGLGNGFEITEAEAPLIVGGGVGVAPLFALARELLSRGQSPQVVLGFNSADEVFSAESIRELGASVAIATVDGSEGTAGFVTDALPSRFDYFYACGPTPMLKALASATEQPGQFSLEERMACGFGACMGCVTNTVDGNQRVCKEGPVFSREELAW
ncbi:dihydroorotate dehydrogenase electron transfer subunit [Actinomycetaceae bacterium WB03_NA08]|uniref:Dihydroorotate dehydrogenase B (NAD(+)), electron transfer subunit n=1 Tax=Scrofimicrobium canadense TaxID=2652290 RepID=A0A6N7W8G3_9ACTO|nr:dihydroorotate dehydrogenase electron transfer subunit [Scrofimicrobium canadense]MSS84428.1 dihydroorotate dehydrogenase electron transfer subunit [Scrofimicrobium canadense]